MMMLYVNVGVLQGSVLEPILFLIFINSLFIQPLEGKITAFADDTALTYSFKSGFDLALEINKGFGVL